MAKSFTLIETLLVMAIFSILIAMAFPVLRLFLTTNYLNISTTEIIQVLRQAQANAINGAGDSKWGIFFDTSNNKFIFFKGDNFLDRVQSYDLATELPKSVGIKNINLSGGASEIVFEKTSGKTDQYGSLTISGLNYTTKNIVINEYGVIETY